MAGNLKQIIKRRVGAVITNPVMGIVIARITGNRFRSRGLLVETSDASITPAIKAALFWNVYESSEIRFVRRYLRSDLDTVELGSSLGVMACQIRNRLEKSRKLVCVEANPRLRAVIERNLALNGFAGNTEVVTAAIDYSGASTILFGEGADTLRGRKGEQGTAVQAMTLEQLLNDHKIGAYALVSDIEGAEAGFVLHGKKALASCQQIVIELHDPIVDGKRVTVDDMVRSLIHDHGFRQVDRYGAVCVFDRQEAMKQAEKR
jgi:FkbM family methyltransferase